MTTLAVLRDPTLRLIAWALLLLGALNASVYPYQSLVGIERIGLSEATFALILVSASAVSVSASVLLDILSDQKANRRRIALFTAASGATGVGLMLIAPSPLTFALCHGLLFPVASSLYGQFFALADEVVPGREVFGHEVVFLEQVGAVIHHHGAERLRHAVNLVLPREELLARRHDAGVEAGGLEALG